MKINQNRSTDLSTSSTMAEGGFNLDYDAPQFLNFEEIQKEEAMSDYFAVDHERSKFCPSELDSSTSTLAASPSLFPVHNGPFLFKAKGNEIVKTTSVTKNKLNRKSVTTKVYELRATPARMSRAKSDLASPVAKKVKAVCAPAKVIDNLRRISIKHNLLLPRASSSPKVQENSMNQVKEPRKRANSETVVNVDAKQPRFQNKPRPVAIPKRVRYASASNAAEKYDPYIKVDFKAMLRSNAATSVKTDKPGRITVTKPFNFTETRKRKINSETAPEPYISMAQKLKNFEKERGIKGLENQTSKGNSLSMSSNSSYRITKPFTPKLRTLTRHREVNVISAEEKEKQEAEEMKKFQFKANPVNHNIFEVKAIVHEKKKLTIPKFKLPSERMLKKRIKPVFEEPKYEFRARPAPKAILDHVTGLTEKVHISPTKPKTPPFALKERANKWTVKELNDAEKEKNVQPAEKMKKQLKAAVQMEPSLTQQSFDKKPTVPEPFSFHVKDLERFAKRDERVKKELEKLSTVPQFHANDMPSPSLFGVPQKKVLPPTEPKPFDLQIDRRGQLLTEKWQKQVEEDLRKQREAVKFKAQPSTVTQKPAFQPKKPDKPLTEVLNVRLYTEERAHEREQFDMICKEKQDQLEHERMLKEMEKEKEDKIQEAEIRAQLVHKANPVRQYVPLAIKPSTKDLTVPQTPDFATAKRLKRSKEN